MKLPPRSHKAQIPAFFYSRQEGVNSNVNKAASENCEGFAGSECFLRLGTYGDSEIEVSLSMFKWSVLKTPPGIQRRPSLTALVHDAGHMGPPET